MSWRKNRPRFVEFGGFGRKIKERLGSLCSETIFTTLGQAQSELATLASPLEALDARDVEIRA